MAAGVDSGRSGAPCRGGGICAPGARDPSQLRRQLRTLDYSILSRFIFLKAKNLLRKQGPCGDAQVAAESAGKRTAQYYGIDISPKLQMRKRGGQR